MIKNEFQKCDYIECIPDCEILVKATETEVRILSDPSCTYKQMCEEVVPCQKILIENCLKEGAKQSKNAEIYHTQLCHDAGAVIVFKNESKSNTLEETITFDMKNLVVHGQDD